MESAGSRSPRGEARARLASKRSRVRAARARSRARVTYAYELMVARHPREMGDGVVHANVSHILWDMGG